MVIILAVMANTMAMTARERLSEYATLKALGFAPGYVAALVLGESLAIAPLGGLAGIACTFPVGGVFATQTGTLFPVLEVAPRPSRCSSQPHSRSASPPRCCPARRAARVRIVDGLRAIG